MLASRRDGHVMEVSDVDPPQQHRSHAFSKRPTSCASTPVDGLHALQSVVSGCSLATGSLIVTKDAKGRGEGVEKVPRLGGKLQSGQGELTSASFCASTVGLSVPVQLGTTRCLAKEPLRSTLDLSLMPCQQGWLE